jgi:hypothetical protein
LLHTLKSQNRRCQNAGLSVAEVAKESDSYADDGFLGRLRKPRVAPTQHLWRYNSRQS